MYIVILVLFYESAKHASIYSSDQSTLKSTGVVTDR